MFKKPNPDWLAIAGLAISVVSLVLAGIIVVKLIGENIP
jgi:hypothetical protein